MAETNKTHNLERYCIHMYEKFKIMGKEGLQERYPAMTKLYSCFALYATPYWHFVGKDAIDKKYPNQLENQLTSEIIASYKIGPSKYFVKFQVCSEDGLKSKYILIETELQKFLGMISKPIKGNCGGFWVILKAIEPEKTQFSWVFTDNPNFQLIRKLL